MKNFQDRGVWIRIRSGKIMDPDPVCPKRLDPDQVCHERLDPATPLPLPLCSPMVVIFSNLNDTLRANLRVTLISQ